MRDIEPVLALERKVEIVAGDTRDLLGLEAEELPDPVVLVHDEVARAQVRERLERPAEPCIGARGTLPEDLDVGEERDAEVPPDEAAASGADDEAELRVFRERHVVLDDGCRDLAQEPLRAKRLALVRERDEHATALAQHPGQLRLGLGEAARGDSRSLGLESMRLGVREGVELRRAVERDRVETVVGPDALDLRRLPDEVGRAGDGWDENGGAARRLVVEPRFGRQLGLDEIASPLSGRIDDRALDGMERALRERRERAHLLDLVPEELNAKRLSASAREDVDETAANRDLTAFLDSIDTRIARQRQRLDEHVEPDVVAHGDTNRLRSLFVGRHAFGERSRRGGDETSGGEHVERAGPFPYEMRGRVEPGAESHTPARKESDLRGVEVPGDCLGGIARVLVLGQHGEQALVAARLVQRREDERQRGVRYARRCRKGGRERAKLVALGERRDECVER